MKDNKLANEVALNRIGILLDLARMNTKSGNEALAKRYIRLAKRLSRYRVKIPKRFDSHICKRCGALLIPGINARVRLASSKRYIIYRCECGREAHIFYKWHLTSSKGRYIRLSNCS